MPAGSWRRDGTSAAATGGAKGAANQGCRETKGGIDRAASIARHRSRGIDRAASIARHRSRGIDRAAKKVRFFLDTLFAQSAGRMLTWRVRPSAGVCSDETRVGSENLTKGPLRPP
jgi:hypothetical protein